MSLSLNQFQLPDDQQKRISFFRNRPALLGFLALAAGLTLAYCFEQTAALSMGAFAVNIALLAIACIAFYAIRMSAILRLSVLGIACLALGFGLLASEELSFNHSPLRTLSLLRTPVTQVTGIVISPVEASSFGYTFLFRTKTVRIDSSTLPIEGTLYVELFNDTKSEHARLPSIGDNLKLITAIQGLHAPRNPYEYPFDLKLHEREGVEARAALKSRFDYYYLGDGHAELSFWEGWAARFATVREQIAHLIASAITDIKSVGFIEAVVLGERTEMEAEVKQDFTRSGVAHILAVSGFNVAIIALVVFQLLKLFGLTKRWLRLSTSMVLVALYCAIVGFQPSVVRAFIMIELYFAARTLERKPDTINIIASAGLLTLLLRPYDLFDAGFQLSYAAVFGIAILHPEIKRLFIASNPSKSLFGRTRHWVAEALSVSTAATIATLPVTILQFNRVSLVGIVANIPIIPLSSLITSLGFLLIPLTAISSWLGTLYGEASALLTKGLLVITKGFANLPFASVEVASPHVVLVIFFAVSVLYILRASTRKRMMGRLSLCLACILLMGSLRQFTQAKLLGDHGLSLMVFDVGQGDCLYLKTPSGKGYFIDFGPMSWKGNAAVDRSVTPFMVNENIREVSGGFISHMHRDHYGGASAIAARFDGLPLYTSGERVRDDLASDLDSLATIQRIHPLLLSRGTKLMLDDSVSLFVLNPDSTFIRSSGPRNGELLNNGSLVFKIQYGNTSMLFLGDIEASDEEELVHRYGDFLKCDLVKVAHHGSASSSSNAFVQTAHPSFAVISVGEHNPFNHPAPITLNRWHQAGATICRTDRDGGMLFKSNGDKVWKEGWQ